MPNQTKTQRAPHFTLAAVVALGAFAAACATEKAKPEAETKPEVAAAASVEAKAEGSGAAEAKALVTVTPTLGGSVFAVGDYQAELAIHENGAVKGLAFDAQGKALVPTQVSEFTVALNAEGNLKPHVSLLWNVECNCFQGQAELKAALSQKPVNVSFEVGGEAQAGTLAAYTLLPKLDLSAQADLAGAAGARVAVPDVKAKLTAGVKATNDAKANLNGKLDSATKTAAKAGATAKASAAVSIPKPTVQLNVKQSASTTSTAKPNTGANANVKAKASFGFGSK